MLVKITKHQINMYCQTVITTATWNTTPALKFNDNPFWDSCKWGTWKAVLKLATCICSDANTASNVCHHWGNRYVPPESLQSRLLPCIVYYHESPGIINGLQFIIDILTLILVQYCIHFEMLNRTDKILNAWNWVILIHTSNFFF